jgi:hypothetical protein
VVVAVSALLACILVFVGIDGSRWDTSSVVAAAPAVRVETTVQVASTPSPAPPAPPSWARCPQWWDVALDAGFTVDEMPTVDRVMWCESNCQPGAHNRSGASGLMQVMPMWFDGRDPYDPATNLTMAVEIKHKQGWHAWSCY